VLVDDGSDDDTARFLAGTARGSARVRLITNSAPPHGYTIAANLGLRAAVGEYLVLLNSDTIVTAGWLERVIACGEADERIGIVGPVSNAASHQSVPKVRDRGSWATNPLPGWLTVDGMGVAVASASSREHPRVPFVNGYCYAIKRRTLDAVGYLDEEHFAEGYCEENDFSLRARDAGFTGAVADDAFVFHAKSRSYTPEGRNTHAKRNYARFLEKHGVEKVQPLVDQLEEFPPVFDLGRHLERVLAEPGRLVEAVHERLGRAVEPVFVLPGVAHGGSGGSHSIVQEAAGLRALGVPARIAIAEKGLERATVTYPDRAELFVPYRDEADLRALAAEANVLIATHSDSVPDVAQAVAQHPHVVPAYYVQDYEPFFWPEGSEASRRSAASYTALPGGALFAKTDWVCNLVGAVHGVAVHKVEPSIDAALYRAPEDARDEGRIVIAAMVRLRTPRRQPRTTVRLLEQLAREHGDRVELVTFGCAQKELESVTELDVLRDGHRGLLSRGDVAQLLQRAHLFVDLSVYQAFGRTALEAMACGCVPVVPAAGGAWEFAEPGVNALVCDTRDEAAVHAAVTGALADPEQRAELSVAGLATAARYSIERASLSEFSLFASALLAKDRLDRNEQVTARAG
jgi:GT2 family glycosyltransferase